MTYAPLYRGQGREARRLGPTRLFSQIAHLCSLCFKLHHTQTEQSCVSMASRAILFGFAAVLSCLELFEAITKIQAWQSLFVWLMTIAFVLAIVATFGLTLLLVVSYIRALDTNAAAGPGHAGRRFLERLVKATVLTALAALIAGATMQLVSLGYVGAIANDDVGWVHTEK